MSGYRDPDLTNEQAWAAMQTACQNVVRSVLAERRALFDLGFAANHSMCTQLDDVARAWSINEQVVRRDWLYNICPEGHDVVSTPFGYQIAQIVDPPAEPASPSTDSEAGQ